MKKTLIRIYEYFKKIYKITKRTFVAPKIPQNPDGKIYINVGCGNDSGKEFTNVDVLKFPNIHHVQDITDLSNFADNTVDMVYASHVVEHLPREKFFSTLKEWKRVLKRGGIFRFGVPDFDKLIEIYHGNSNNVEIIRDQVLGQKPPYDNHYTLWNFEFAKKVMEEAGFVNTRKWDYKTADHHDFKDRSSRSIKAGDKEVFFSLNIEAEKA